MKLGNVKVLVMRLEVLVMRLGSVEVFVVRLWRC